MIAILPDERLVLRGIAPALVPTEFRTVNLRYWALKLGVTTPTLEEALHRLRQRGVLARGQPFRGLDSYKLLQEPEAIAALIGDPETPEVPE